MAAVVLVSAWGCSESNDLPGYEKRPAGTLSFSKDIAPIIFDQCVACHRPNGSAPFALLTYDDVRQRAERIEQVTLDRLMPPWSPNPDYGEFEGARLLSGDQIGMIQQWVREGAAQGDPSDLPATPVFRPWPNGPPDLELETDGPYSPTAGVESVRNFVFRTGLDKAMHIRAVDLRIDGDPRAVQEVVVLIDRTQRSRHLDASDDGPGFGGRLAYGTTYVPGHPLQFVPGREPSSTGGSTIWSLNPGTDLVAQVRFAPSATPKPVTVRVGLYEADEPSRRPLVVSIGSRDIDIPPGSTGTSVADAYELPVPVQVLSILPRIGARGRSIDLWADLPDGGMTWLLRVTNWQLQWNGSYRFAKPVNLPRGAVIKVDIDYDNSSTSLSAGDDTLKRLVYGTGPDQERGELWLQVMVGSTNFETLEVSHRRKQLLMMIVGYEKWLELDPDDGRTHIYLGRSNLELGDDRKAISYFKEALALNHQDPFAQTYLAGALNAKRMHRDAITHLRRAIRKKADFDETHAELAEALHHTDRMDEAIESYRKAVELNPWHVAAQYQLGLALAEQGDDAAAAEHYAMAAAADPDHLEAQNNLGNVLFRLQRYGDAVDHFQAVLRLDPDDPKVRFNLAGALLALGRGGDALVHYSKVTELLPTYPEPWIKMAWIYATTPDDKLRDPPRALELIDRVSKMKGGDSPVLLDTVAAAYAANGEFEIAVRKARQAIALASRGRFRPFIGSVQKRLALYEEGRPYLMTPAAEDGDAP